MRCLTSVFVIAIWALPLAGVSAESPEKAQEAFAEGQALLAEGEFDGALRAFKRAARGQRSNEEYAQQYALVRQIVELRKQLPKEQDAERWLSGAAALQAFYHENKLFGESLPLDRQRFHRAPSTKSAVMLAKTQLALQMNPEAANLLAGLKSELQSPHAKVLHALALIRMDRIDPARALVRAGKQTDTVEPGYFVDLARVQVALGEQQVALGTLKRSIELTPPSRLEQHKVRLRSSPDFADLVGTAAFDEVLKTSSTIKESPCSGGSGCGKCPKRSKCAGKNTHHKSDKP
ncbi:MAG: tetratricopeptide repeat protein [Planctomycetota bacterium]|jgi:tetratricopeptide (TPR) repeat protein